MPDASYCCVAQAEPVTRNTVVIARAVLLILAPRLLHAIVLFALRLTLLRWRRTIAPCAPESDHWPIQLGVVRGKFLDLKELIFVHVAEVLPGVPTRPPDFQSTNPSALPSAIS